MLKIEGKIKKVFDSVTYTNFEKRIFWLDDCAEKFRNIYALELWKNDCTMIDNYKEGDFIIAYIDLKGILWEEKDGKEQVKNTLKCWNIEKDGVTFKKI
jgi:Domain of unknown function (DUF3127)